MYPSTPHGRIGMMAFDHNKSWVDYLEQTFKSKQREHVIDAGNCLVKKFFENQKSLPEHQRSKFAMISCPCRKCNPGHL